MKLEKTAKIKNFCRLGNSKRISKKSQVSGASGAAALIAIIAALVVLYILFIPPEERAKLIEEESIAAPRPSAMGENITLLLEYPGTIYKQDGKEIEHLIPSFSLSIKKEAAILKNVQSLFVQRALFKNRRENITFKIETVEDIENVLLNFYVKKSSGRLIIALNNKEIYNSELKTGNIEPIKIPSENLKDGENILEFSASSIGLIFWRSNEYILESVQITADLISREGLTSENIFLVSENEKDNLDEVYLRFVPECTVTQVGKLNVEINGFNIYSAVPDCGKATPKIYFAPEYIKEGENRITFQTDKGGYIIDLIKLNTKLKEARYPVYYFEVDSVMHANITKTDTNATLVLKFIDDTSTKRGRVILNNHIIGFDLTNRTFEKRVDTYLEKGNNALRIEPEEKVLEIVELSIIVEEKD